MYAKSTGKDLESFKASKLAVTFRKAHIDTCKFSSTKVLIDVNTWSKVLTCEKVAFMRSHFSIKYLSSKSCCCLSSYFGQR